MNAPEAPRPATTFGRRTVLAGSLAAAAVGALRVPAGAATPPRPWTVPALREWVPASGSFTLGPAARVVVAGPGLDETAALLAADLSALAGTAVPVVAGGSAAPGEILLRLGPDAQLGAEGYVLQVGSTVVVTAPTPTGVYYGARSLVQVLRQGLTVPAGTARDWPRYAERGLMIDLGRKEYTFAWLLDRITAMGELKLNHLHLHFTDDLGWRIESGLTPGVHSDVAFTHDQIRELLAHAARHQVRVVPEVDLPGHLTAGLRNYPQFQLKNAFGQPAAGRLDYTNPQARAWAGGLVAEYLELFPGPYFHIGGDEFMPAAEMLVHPQLQKYAKTTYGAGANAKDGIIGFLNELDLLVRSRGKRTRVWNDGIGGAKAVPLNPAIDVEWWTDVSPIGDVIVPTPQQLLANGHRVNNSGWYPTYYTTAPAPPLPDMKYTYECWSVNRFHGAVYLNGQIGTPWQVLSPSEPRNLGSKLHVWNDDPEAATEAEQAIGIAPRLQVLAQKTWDSPALVPSYAEFQQVCAAAL